MSDPFSVAAIILLAKGGNAAFMAAWKASWKKVKKSKRDKLGAKAFKECMKVSPDHAVIERYLEECDAANDQSEARKHVDSAYQKVKSHSSKKAPKKKATKSMAKMATNKKAKKKSGKRKAKKKASKR